MSPAMGANRASPNGLAASIAPRPLPQAGTLKVGKENLATWSGGTISQHWDENVYLSPMVTLGPVLGWTMLRS